MFIYFSEGWQTWNFSETFNYLKEWLIFTSKKITKTDKKFATVVPTEENATLQFVRRKQVSTNAVI